LTAYNSDGKSSAAEKFLFKELLMKEIKMLDAGYAIRINGVIYFLQARLIQLLFDLKELSNSVNMQCKGCKPGCCFCYKSHGIWRFGKVINTGDTIRLPLKQFFRGHGQTAGCCPPGYYSQDKNNIENRIYYAHGYHTKKGFVEKTFNGVLNMKQEERGNFWATVKPKFAKMDQLKKSRVAQDLDWHLAPICFNICDKQNEVEFLTHLFDSDEPSIFFHDDMMPVEIVTKLDRIFFEFCDGRPYVGSERKDTDFHKENAEIAMRTGNPSNGVTGPFYGFDSEYVKLEKHVHVDPTHTLANELAYIRELWMGKLPKMTAELKLYCDKAKIFPFIIYDKEKLQAVNKCCFFQF
jgi:hypothetical protein